MIKKGTKKHTPSIDKRRPTPTAALRIDTANKHTTIMLQKVISSGMQHGLGLKAGILNAVDGNCLFNSVINNTKSRKCHKTKQQ